MFLIYKLKWEFFNLTDYYFTAFDDNDEDRPSKRFLIELEWHEENIQKWEIFVL